MAAEHLQQFHVAGIGRTVIKYFCCPGNAAYDFCQRRIVKIAETLSRFVAEQCWQDLPSIHEGKNLITRQY